MPASEGVTIPIKIDTTQAVGSINQVKAMAKELGKTLSFGLGEEGGTALHQMAAQVGGGAMLSAAQVYGYTGSSQAAGFAAQKAFAGALPMLGAEAGTGLGTLFGGVGGPIGGALGGLAGTLAGGLLNAQIDAEANPINKAKELVGARARFLGENGFSLSDQALQDALNFSATRAKAGEDEYRRVLGLNAVIRATPYR